MINHAQPDAITDDPGSADTGEPGQQYSATPVAQQQQQQAQSLPYAMNPAQNQNPNQKWQYPMYYPQQQAYSDPTLRESTHAMHYYYPQHQLQFPGNGGNNGVPNGYQASPSGPTGAAGTSSPFSYYNSAMLSQPPSSSTSSQQQLTGTSNNSPTPMQISSSSSAASGYPRPKIYQYPGFQQQQQQQQQQQHQHQQQGQSQGQSQQQPQGQAQQQTQATGQSQSSTPQQPQPQPLPSPTLNQSQYPLRQFSQTPVGFQTGSAHTTPMSYMMPSQPTLSTYDSVASSNPPVISPPSSANPYLMTSQRTTPNNLGQGNPHKNSKKIPKKVVLDANSSKLPNDSQVHSYDVKTSAGTSMISYDLNGKMTRPRVTTTMWEDENTLCYQVEANGVSVVRRADNDMINGTKLLNVAKITRGRRDGILKAERIRHVVKIGSMHLKGVWIPFERAHAMAQREKIVDYLYPLFVKNIQSVLRQATNSASSDMEHVQPTRATYIDDDMSSRKIQQQQLLQQQLQQQSEHQQHQQHQQLQQQQPLSYDQVSPWYANMPNRQTQSQPYGTSLSYGQYHNIPNGSQQPNAMGSIASPQITPSNPVQFVPAYRPTAPSVGYQNDLPTIPPPIHERDSNSTISVATTSSTDSLPAITPVLRRYSTDNKSEKNMPIIEESNPKSNTPGKLLTGIVPPQPPGLNAPNVRSGSASDNTAIPTDSPNSTNSLDTKRTLASASNDSLGESLSSTSNKTGSHDGRMS